MRILRATMGRCGLRVSLDATPWPDGGAVQRFGDQLVIFIDSRQRASDQLWTLAHEAGHILFGHYELSDEVWTLVSPGDPAADEWEWEAEYFAGFATRTPGTPAEWFLGEQLELEGF